MRVEVRAWVVAVHLRGKDRQRAQIQSVSVFKHVEAVVAERDSDYVCNERGVSRDCPHPAYVVVAPLNVDVGEGHKLVHYLVGSRTSVENISDDVQAVYRQASDK